MKFMFSYAVNVKLNIWTRARDVWERNKGKYVQRIGKSKSYSAMHKLLLWKLVRVNLRISPENMKLFPSTLFPITFGAAILYLLHVYYILNTAHDSFSVLVIAFNVQFSKLLRVQGKRRQNMMSVQKSHSSMKQKLYVCAILIHWIMYNFGHVLK